MDLKYSKNKVKMIFETPTQAKNFMEWFSNSGEQDYFDWVDNTGSEGVNSFDYDFIRNIIEGEGV